MLKILGRKTSSNVMKVLWLCDELGLEYDRVDIGGPFGGNDKPEYLAKNPNGLVPTIEDDGFVLWESHAVCRYIASKYGKGSTIWPDDLKQRADADRWMDWLHTRAAGPIGTIFRIMVRTPEDKRDMNAVKKAVEEGGKILGILDRHLASRKFVTGDNLTLGDIPLGVHTFRWFELAKDRPSLPNYEAWYKRLQERPAYRKNCMNELV